MRGGTAVWTAGALLALAPVGAEAACPPVELFYDEKKGGFYFTAKDGEKL